MPEELLTALFSLLKLLENCQETLIHFQNILLLFFPFSPPLAIGWRFYCCRREKKWEKLVINCRDNARVIMQQACWGKKQSFAFISQLRALFDGSMNGTTQARKIYQGWKSPENSENSSSLLKWLGFKRNPFHIGTWACAACCVTWFISRMN